MVQYKEKIIDLLELNKNKRADVFIYGAGAAGKTIKAIIDNTYPNLTIKGFIDTYKNGVFEGKKIININEYQHQEGNVIFIASHAREDIVDTLISKGILDYNITDEFWLSVNMFSKKEIRSNERKVKYICSFLDSKIDRELYLHLLEARTHGTEHSFIKYIEETKTTVLALNNFNLFKERFKEHTNNQYLDFVSTEHVQTVVQAGVYDGEDIMKVCKITPKLDVVYGFEPLGNKNLLPEIQELIDCGKVIIEPLALYDKKTTINFFPNKAGSFVSDRFEPIHNTYQVETVSLDEYCTDNIISSIDLIFCDIENAEIKFLKGAEKIIKKSRPQLAISIYHSKEHFIEIPLYLNAMLENYIFKIGHYGNTLNETTLYAIPAETINS